MKTMLETMKKKKYGIPEDKISIFDHIFQTYKGDECDDKFLKAMEKHLTKEQRFLIYEQNGGCKGTGYDKERKAFAIEHANMPLVKRLELFAKKNGRDIILSNDNTIIVTFVCSHGYYKHAPKGNFKYPLSVESYFERCAGGRLYELEIALGIKLKIKSVDVSSLNENIITQLFLLLK